MEKLVTYLSLSNGGEIAFYLAKEDAGIGYHTGQCENDIKALISSKPYIREQLDLISYKEMCSILDNYDCDYDAGDGKEILEMSVLWIACGNIIEGE